jgi:subtilisin
MSFWNWKKLWILLLAGLVLNGCLPHPKFSLNQTGAARGSSVTASLTDLDGTTATVKVADLDAQITEAKRDSVTFTIPSNTPAGTQKVVIKSGDRIAEGQITITEVPADASFTLDRKKAARGEAVTATTTGIDLVGATLTIAGKEVAKEVSEKGTFTFKIPDDAPAGPQTAVLKTEKGELKQDLGVLGEVVPGKLTLLLKTDVTEAVLRERLAKLGFELERIRDLGGTDGPCASDLADIDVGGKPLGQALEELEKEGIALHTDGRSGYKASAVDHLSAISATIARNNGYTGAGSLIAILDTGVSPHTELTGRLILPFNAITGSELIADVVDGFDDANVPTIPVEKRQEGVEGHGTPIAILAAGSTSGVAPEAQVMPVKTCDDNGVCFSNDVIVGVCYALTAAQKNGSESLILNLSFGGDTPVAALEAILKYALEKGVQVAAAAGNDGERGSPVHYPAAFDLPGLVAVGALEASTLQCVDFEAQNPSANVTYFVGDTLTDNGVTLTFEEFFEVEGQPITNGEAIIRELDSTPITKELQLGDMNVSFGFDYPLEGLTLSYGNDSAVNNLELNGQQVILADGQPIALLTDLDDRVIAGVTINLIEEDSFGQSVMELSGPIRSFAVGGNFFVLGNLCPRKSSAWQPANFSTRGDYVDIAAPGAGLRSGTPDDTYANAYQGTSFSTPLVAGAMALWKQADPALGPEKIEAYLKDSALKLPFGTNEVGAGLLNLNVDPFNVPPILLVGDQ